ncbi:hypothetical protein BDW59DRAFT_164937 [Aspergillus cavernicola]|uniref:Uncharacterized protein n=1 Tax=Aspergillus cavernicola TaxID=176166 RepID=A0ABR4HW61_9EURO
MGWVGDLFPAYGDHESEKPDNTIPVLGDGSSDINAGFGGKFVWLVASYHNNRLSAMSDIKVVITDAEKPGQMDLAKGAGGLFRYLETTTSGSSKVAELRLLRRKEQVTRETIHGLGYNGWTSDINGGRGGDFLHLVWRNE